MGEKTRQGKTYEQRKSVKQIEMQEDAGWCGIVFKKEDFIDGNREKGDEKRMKRAVE